MAPQVTEKTRAILDHVNLLKAEMPHLSSERALEDARLKFAATEALGKFMEDRGVAPFVNPQAVERLLVKLFSSANDACMDTIEGHSNQRDFTPYRLSNEGYYKFLTVFLSDVERRFPDRFSDLDKIDDLDLTPSYLKGIQTVLQENEKYFQKNGRDDEPFSGRELTAHLLGRKMSGELEPERYLSPGMTLVSGARFGPAIDAHTHAVLYARALRDGSLNNREVEREIVRSYMQQAVPEWDALSAKERGMKIECAVNELSAWLRPRSSGKPAIANLDPKAGKDIRANTALVLEVYLMGVNNYVHPKDNYSIEDQFRYYVRALRGNREWLCDT